MSFTLYPAIDLKDGRVVRLRRGALAQMTVYAEDPAAQALAFREAGFAWLHVVDLDGAFAGRPANAAAVRAILAAVPEMPVQLGGGIRTMAVAEAWLAAGVRRIVLGSAAVQDPPFVRAACRAFPGQIAIAIDARDGRVAIAGWAETSMVEAETLARRYEEAGAAALIFTDIGRDGMLSGVNVTATAALARAVRLPIIASGGIAGPQDIRALRAAEARIAGAIIGRALYDGVLSPAAALAAAAGP